MIITDFFIYEPQKEHGAHFSLSPKANIIVSDDSKVGKSCLLKSLFYTLGLDIKNSFAQGWDSEKLLFKVKYKHNGKNGYIIRSRDLFHVDTEKEPLDEKGFATWLMNLFGLDIKLPLKQVEALHTPYVSAILAPFYIDQDSSWKGTPFKNTVSSLQMYAPGSFPLKVFEGLFGISNDQQIALEEKQAQIVAQKKEIDKRLQVLLDLSYSFIQQDIQSPLVNIKYVENNIKLWIAETESLRNEIDKEKNAIFSLQRDIDSCEMDKEEMLRLLEETDRMFRKIEHRCSLCHSVLTKEQSQQRLKLSGNRYSILQYLNECKQKIVKKQKDLQKHFDYLRNLNQRYTKINEKLQKDKESLSVQNVIEANSQALLRKKYFSIAKDLRASSANCSNQIKNLEKELIQLKKETLKLKKEIEASFETAISHMLTYFPDIKIDEVRFLKFTSISDSGTRLNQLFFSIYIIYFHLLIKYAKIQFILGLDSPITTEPSDNNLKKMYTLIEQYLLKEGTQTIVVMLRDKLSYLTSQYHLINLAKPILGPKDIEQIRAEFDCMFPTKREEVKAE